MKLLIWAIVFVDIVQYSWSFQSNILMLSPFGSTSHMNLFLPLSEALGSRDHNVTLFTVYKPQRGYSNVHEVACTDEVTESYDTLRHLMKRSGKEGFTIQIVNEMMEWQDKACSSIFRTSPVRTWIEEDREFDVIFIDGVMNECFYPIANMLSDSVIILNSASMFPWIANAMDVPYPYAHVPNAIQPISNQMTFWQRTVNLLLIEMFAIMDAFITYPTLNAVVRRSFPQANDVKVSMEEAKMVFVNADPVFSYPKPNTPAVVEIGGIHCRPPKPLPQNLLNIVEASTEGFIIFSLGTIHDGLMSDDDMKKFISVFAKLDLTVIWKFEGNITVPPNVKLVSWLPQQDLLGHPKARGFITHCGLLSMQEAIYHGVPMVGLPAFVDQPGNAKRGEMLGVMAVLNWNDLQADQIYEAIVHITTADSVRSAIKRYSAMFKDRPNTPIEEAVYWTEYAVRHHPPNHLRGEPKNMHVVAYFLIDVLLLITSASCVLGMLTFYCFKITLRKLGGSR